LKIIWHWNNEHNDNEEIHIITVHGVHCRINEPWRQPSTQWYSHKRNKPGLAYELGIAIHSNQLVWVNVLFHAGNNSLVMYWVPNDLKSMIPNGKKVIGDEGYRAEPQITTRNHQDSELVNTFKQRAKAQHEMQWQNQKLWDPWAVLPPWCCQAPKAAFEAVCILVQYDMENGHPIFEV
jgi:hypothetical protein